MKNRNETQYAATAVSIGGRAVLIVGKSGSGKSDLALRLIDRGATLIADDKVILRKTDAGLYAFPHPETKGLLEIRGIGIIRTRFVQKKKIVLVIDLNKEPERFPEVLPVVRIAETDIPLIGLNAFDASAAIKTEIAVRRVCNPQQFIT